ncbi:MAG: IS66 family insertion sequence element accessory protein TnpB [Desulfocapsa sp.]|nr:IS66 family insertion sequence element accessory protein TnpB [Desulfocapsa sp.]
MEIESRKVKLEKLRKFWRFHLDKWADSGLLQSEYCRQHNLIYHRFVYWKARHKNKNLPVTLVQLPTEAITARQSVIKLNLPRGCQVEIPDDFSEDTLKRILATLQEL